MRIAVLKEVEYKNVRYKYEDNKKQKINKRRNYKHE